MQKLNFSISIKAPKQKVWDFMLGHASYRIWTTPFSAESSYQGSWEKGAKIKFVDNQGNGMVSEIAESRPGEFVSIKHLGEIRDGKEDFDSPAIKAWSPAYENYTFTEKDGQTEVQIEMDCSDEWVKMMSDMWPKAAEKLKDICENRILVDAVINAPMEKVWDCWNKPEHIKGWAFAMDTWEAPFAENDLREGGKFVTTMAAKDGSVKFDFGGTYTKVVPNKMIEYTMGEGKESRKATIFFDQLPEGVRVTELFDMEHQNSEEMQKSGWQSILNNFKKYTESHQ